MTKPNKNCNGCPFRSLAACIICTANSKKPSKEGKK